MNNLRTIKKQGGFTLIELMIVIAIIAILAAIALPAYQSYIKRTQVTEVLAAASGARTEIAEYVASNGELPDSASYSIQSSSSKFVDKTEVTGSGSTLKIIATSSDSINGTDADSKNIELIPTIISTTSLQVNWDCDPGTMPPEYLPGSCQNE